MQILVLMLDVTRKASWSGNIETQRAFTKALEGLGLKSSGYQRDANSGGARTYLAQLEGLGLIFWRDEDQRFWTTIAGQNLLQEKQPLLVMQTQLLRYQYPSPYGNNQNVKINPAVRVHPFLFLLDLIDDKELNGLSNEEFVFPVIYGHNHDCFQYCKEKILRWRKVGGDGLDLVDSTSDLSTPRTAGRRTAEAAWRDLKDVGNTFKNALESNNLVSKDGESGRYFVVGDARPLIQAENDSRDRFVPVSSEESFAQAYGRFNRIKDTRRLVAEETAVPLEGGSSIILSRFFAHAGVSVATESQNDWIDETAHEFGFSRALVQETIAPFLDKALPIFEATYLDLSRGGKLAGLSFEKATASLFAQKLAFDTRLTGQVKRTGIGGFSDLLLIPVEPGYCAIVDTKASGRYGLDSADFHKMANNYAKNFTELVPDRKLEFCAYVAGGFTDQISSRLSALKAATTIPASAISARELLRLAERAPGIAGQASVRASFRQGGIVMENMIVF